MADCYGGAGAYEPSDQERCLLDEAVAELERGPDAGQPWEQVRADIWQC